MIRNKCIPLCTVFLCSLLLTGTLFARGGQEEAPAPPETDAATIQTEAPSPAQDAELLPMDPAVSSGRLANGLSFYLRQNSEPENRVFLRLVVNAGSILETEEELGIAHFVEHAAFLGTEAYDQDQIVRYLESIGMRFGPNVNAYTSFDETVYMLQIPADDPEKLERGIHILQQWASAVSFEPQRIETERGVIQEEWRVGLGASQRFLDKQFPILFKDSRYADRLPIGNPEVFMNATHEDLRDFYERWYRPDLMSVIAVGDFEPSEMEALITEYFGRIPAEKNPTERPLYPVAEHEETLFAPFSDPEAGNTWISIYNKQPPQPLRTKSEYRKQLEHRVFADIMNTRFEELSRRPDAPFMAAGAAHGSLVRTSYAAIMQAVTEENRIHDGFEALLTEAIRARTHGFSEAEVERGRRRLHRQMQSAYNERNNTPSSAYTTEYTRHFLEGEAIPGIEYEWELTRELLPQISVDDINKLAQEYIGPPNQVVTISAAETDRLQLPDSEELEAILSDVQSREIAASDARDEIDDELMPVLPEPGEVVETRHHEEVQTREWTLSNGITVLVRPTDFRSDEIRMQAYQKGGNSVVDNGDIYSAAFAAPVAQQSGIAHLTKIQLDQHLAGREVQVSPFIHEYTHGFSGSSSTDDLEMMLQLVHLYTVSPRIDEESYDFLMRQVQANLERRENQPDAVFADTLQSIIANDNPRMEPLRLSDLDKVDFETVRQTYLDTFADLSDTVFVFVGSIDPETMQPLTEQYLGSLPTGIQDTQRIPHPIDPPAGITSEEIYFGQEDSSRIAIVFTGDYDGSPESEYALTALRDVLRIQLRETIREEEGGTYGVQVSSSSQSYPDNHYQISIVFNTDPIRAEELTRRIHNEIAYIQENGPGDDILQRVQETHRRDYESSMRSNSWWLNNLRSARYRNESLDQFLDRADLIEELSPEMLIQAARNMLPQDEYIQLLMYPQDN